MKKTLMFLSYFLLCVPCISAAAQPNPAAKDFSFESVLNAMADGGDGTGVWIVTWLREKNAAVKFDATIPGPSAFRIETDGTGRRPVILINENIKARADGYLYYAALIAREGAELIHLGMPDSAEKRYMIDSCAAEVFFEMFGARIDLPVFNGVRDEELGDQIQLWIRQGADSAPQSIARQGGYKLLDDLINETEQVLAQAAQNGADTTTLTRKLAALKSSKSYYNNEFASKEKCWWMLYHPQ